MSDNSGSKASEDARRFYRENHGARAATDPSETMIKGSSSTVPAEQAPAAAGPQAGGATPAAKPPRDEKPTPSQVPDSSLALGETSTQGSGGPHILDRSFSGTYKD